MGASFQAKTPDPLAGLKKGAMVFLGIWAVIALWSGHRAIWQVQRHELSMAGSELHAGTPIRVFTQSSGRVHVTVVLEVLQNGRSETLTVRRISGNRPTFVPFWRQLEIEHVVRPEQLAGIQPGPAVVRATAHGASQWMRTPPPKVRELNVQVAEPSTR